jgi:glycolate oxidase iron-sulfur subunit
MKEYDRLLADDPQWAERARAFTGRVRDINELLADLGPPRAPRKRMDLRVAYHDACHLAHAQGIRAQPRELLRQIPGIELVTFAEGELCCGSAGIYNLLEPEPARQLGKRKLQNITDAKPDVIATANPGCTLQLLSVAAEEGTPVQVVHPIELIDEAIGGSATG